MWLSNFTLVWAYNVAFAFGTVTCLLNHFTTPVRKEIIQRYEDLLFVIIIQLIFKCYQIFKFQRISFLNARLPVVIAFFIGVCDSIFFYTLLISLNCIIFRIRDLSYRVKATEAVEKID